MQPDESVEQAFFLCLVPGEKVDRSIDATYNCVSLGTNKLYLGTAFIRYGFPGTLESGERFMEI